MSNSGYNLKNRNRQKTPFMQPLCFVQIFKYFPTLLSELIFNGNSQFFTPIFRSKYPVEAGILHHLTLQLLLRLRYYCSQHSELRYHWPLISSLLWGDMTNQSSRQSRATWLEKYEKSYWSWSSSKIYAWFGLNLASGMILSHFAAAWLLPYQNHFHMREMQRCTVKVNAELHFGIFGCGNKKGLKLGRSANPLYYYLQSMLFVNKVVK